MDLDPDAMQSLGLSATDVQNALASQNQISPAGNIKIGTFQYTFHLNDAASTIEAMNNLPIKTVNGATVYMRDVAHVRDGNAPQHSIVHVDGGRAVLTTILKNGSASTLDVVQGIKNMLPRLEQQLPSSLKIDSFNDQSLFVKAAISGVVREGTLAAALTSLMILLFLGSWRSTVIIAISIPLAVLVGLIALWATGQTPQHYDFGRAGAGGGHIWWTTPPSPSRTSTGTWSTARTPLPPSWMAPARSCSRPLFRCSASASLLCRCSRCRAWPAFCSCPWR